MGRWLDSLRASEKITDNRPKQTDKTDKTPSNEVLSVLSVSSGALCENFEGDRTPSAQTVEAAPGDVIHPGIRPAEASASFAKDPTSRTDKTDKTPGRREEQESGVPMIYAIAFATIQHHPPENVPVERWRLCLADARAFFERWGSQAQKLGWSARDLFGLNAAAPMSRYDEMGLLWALRGERVVEFGAKLAKLSGGLTMRKRP
jgi:hypothetical protein